MRLKTKLLLAILGSIALTMFALSVLYLGQLLRQRIDSAYENDNAVAHEVLYSVQRALETGMRGAQVNVDDPEELRKAVTRTLLTDDDLQATLNAVIRYSPAISDVSVMDAGSGVFVSTDPTLAGATLPQRPLFDALRSAGLLEQVREVFGRTRVYTVRVPLQRNGAPFAAVQVGVRSTFLRAELFPSIQRAAVLSALLIGAAVLLAALVSNIALRPLVAIEARLDEMTPDTRPSYEYGAEEEETEDEYGRVSSKLDRLGARMRNVEEVFSEMKGNLDQILSNLQDGLMLFTREGRVVLVSASAARFLNIDRSDVLGTSIYDLLKSDTVLGRAVLDAFRARIALVAEDFVTESGDRVQVSLDFVHDDARSTSALGALLTLRDADSAQQLEDDLEMSRRLSGIGRLTAGVGHEVKNPINAIVVHMELLRNKLGDATPEARRHLEVIQGEIQRLDRVVQMLVDFSRPVEVRLEEVDMRTIIRDVMALSAAELGERGIEMTWELGHAALPVNVDIDLIKQALLNIIQNGGQAMPNGGRLTVRAGRDGRMACVSVRDTGTGIPARLLDKIFNLYFTTRPTGSGIGLAMTFRILQLHNGRVLVESQEGNGAEFTLLVPLSPVDRRTPAGSLASNVTGKATT